MLPLTAQAESTTPMKSIAKGNKKGQGRNNWKCVLVLDRERRRVAGSTGDLAAAIRRGADMRICTEFRNNEHLFPGAANPELVREVADFRVTYLLEDRWVAGIMSLRQPVSPPDGFGERPSMSYFLYNENGLQAIARPYLDGAPAAGRMGPAPLDDHSNMPKMHQFDSWDAGTNAPSNNFVYDFETFKFWVNDDWEEVLSHTADGKVLSGSIDALGEEFGRGRDIKVGVSGLCADMTPDTASAVRHEVFVQCGAGYHFTDTKRFCAGTQPLVRVKPAIPLRYESKGWDFGWLLPRTDGHVARRLFDPYTLKCHDTEAHYALRWFVR